MIFTLTRNPPFVIITTWKLSFISKIRVNFFLQDLTNTFLFFLTTSHRNISKFYLFGCLLKSIYLENKSQQLITMSPFSNLYISNRQHSSWHRVDTQYLRDQGMNGVTSLCPSSELKLLYQAKVWHCLMHVNIPNIQCSQGSVIFTELNTVIPSSTESLKLARSIP